MSNLLALAEGSAIRRRGRMISGVPSAISQVLSVSEVGVRARAVVLAR